MGHSMGSLIARNVIQQYHELDGVILSGTSHPSKIKTQYGLILSTSIKRLFGPKHLSPLFHKAMFGGNSYTKLCNRTAFDWLSGNTKSIDEYINDPYCGFICPISFYNDLIKIVMHASDSSLNKLTRNNLPILIISGSDDPVGGYGKEVKHLASLYQKYGFDHVIFKLYPGLRHEILQEINSVQVMSDITNWILKQI
jgi:alpha-beta hydrolase superfamily lysophospholipase